MMALAADVREQIRSYVAGSARADDLSDWLDAHAQQIHDAEDVELRRLTDLTFSLLEDVFQGKRTDREAKTHLSEAAGIVGIRI